MTVGDCGALVLSLASWVIYFARITKAKCRILPNCAEGGMEETAHKAMEWGALGLHVTHAVYSEPPRVGVWCV